MTAEDFRDCFEVGIGDLFYEMRCSKSCYLCDLDPIALFDVVEQDMLFRNNFLIYRTADFHLHVAGRPVATLSPDKHCTVTLNATATCVNECPSSINI